MPDPPPSSKRPIPAGGTDPRSAPASVAGTGGSGASGLSGMSSAGVGSGVGSGGSTGSPASGSGVAKLGAGKAGRQRFAADELAIPIDYYAQLWRLVRQRGGTARDAARGVRLWHTGPNRFRRYFNRGADPDAWARVQTKVSGRIDHHLAKAGVV